MTTSDNVEVGGPYVENPDFVPNPTDLWGTFHTAGVGPNNDLSVVTPIVDVNRKQTAQAVVDAFDPSSPVPESSVLLPTGDVKPEEAKAAILKQAQAVVDAGPVVLGEKPAVEQEAAKSGDEGAAAAQAEANRNATESSVSPTTYAQAASESPNPAV